MTNTNGDATEYQMRIDNKSVIDVLGVKFHDMSTTMQDMQKALIATGYVK